MPGSWRLCVEGNYDGDRCVCVSDFLAILAGWGDPYTVNDYLSVLANWS